MLPASEPLPPLSTEAGLWLFLDYDGTLAEFSPTPNTVEVRPEIVRLVHELAAKPRLRLAVISGRSLPIIQQLLPVEGIFLGGVYGIEIQVPGGGIVRRGELEHLRPSLDKIKPEWERIIGKRTDFFLEDKGWSLALHCHSEDDAASTAILKAVRQSAEPALREGLFRLLLDEKFVEMAPLQAHKGQAVRYILGRYPFPAGRLLYLGDDDKDEEAFETVHAFGGMNVRVYNPDHPQQASLTDARLDSPEAVREWLGEFIRE